jgi:hypothetical protein
MSSYLGWGSAVRRKGRIEARLAPGILQQIWAWLDARHQERIETRLATRNLWKKWAWVQTWPCLVAQLWLLLLPLLTHCPICISVQSTPPCAATTATNMFVRSMFIQVLFTFVLLLIFSHKNKIKTGVTWNLACSFEVIFCVVVSFGVSGIFVCARGSIPRPNLDRVRQGFL